MRSSWRAATRAILSASVLPTAAALAALTLVGLRNETISARAMMVSAPSVPCNHSDHGPLRPAQVRDGTRRELVPAGAVSLTVCGYNGMNADRDAPAFGLVSSGGSASRRLVGRVTAALDALRPTHGSYSCPMDQRSFQVVTFAYASGPAVVITVDTGGCGIVDNGQIRRLALGAPITGRLQALTTPVVGIDWPAVIGHLRLCGGPSPGRCYIENYNGGDRVVATDAGGAWVAMAPVQHGRFHLRIATAGRYTFAFYTGSRLVKKLEARVTSGETTDVVFPISIY